MLLSLTLSLWNNVTDIPYFDRNLLKYKLYLMHLHYIGIIRKETFVFEIGRIMFSDISYILFLVFHLLYFSQDVRYLHLKFRDCSGTSIHTGMLRYGMK